jgi:alcohol dehydrogenase YqhD (iron-dependent ADH family)
METTETILKDPTDYNARATMMWATTLAFNGVTTAGMGGIGFPAHMIEHSLSALYDIAHGAGLSIILPGWMQYTARNAPSKFCRLAREIFTVSNSDELTAAHEGVNRLKDWFSSIGSPVSLTEANIPPDDIDMIADNAFTLARLWGLKAYTKEVIEEILTICKD